MISKSLGLSITLAVAFGAVVTGSGLVISVVNSRRVFVALSQGLSLVVFSETILALRFDL